LSLRKRGLRAKRYRINVHYDLGIKGEQPAKSSI
jgi:hypothetical protein